ncbi:MAG: class II fructose-bisphosphate aldolase [Micropruina sp.]|uniref:class II fructose-bisphosphate aldolase n=1 Tax=Micropruina sp. TaxID=2737536 RepID=UPI0039E44F21
MLIGLRDALDFAETRNCGIAAVNTPTLELLLAAIKVAERHDVPLIVQHAQVHETVNAIEDIGPVMVELARRSSAPLVVHIDHGETVEYIERGFAVGFNSAMFDGSRLPYDENVELTRQVVEIAGRHGFGVEGELGIMPGREHGPGASGVADETLYTRPADVAAFVQATGVTALACSFGTVHGLYKADPKIDYELIGELRRAGGVPIVMHGGSGLSCAEYRASIERGVRKINYYTYADKAGMDAAKKLLAEHPETHVFCELAVAATKATEENLDALARCLYA